MAKSAFQKRFPYGRLFLLVAILIALPIVLWSVQKAPTQTQEHAAGYTCSSATPNGTCPSGNVCGYDSNIGSYTCMSPVTATPLPPFTGTPTPPSTICSQKPTWSGILGHTDGATSVKYQFTLKNNCSSASYFDLLASLPSSGWTYQYSGCNKNTICKKHIKAAGSITVYVTVARPSSAVAGTYNVKLYAEPSDYNNVYALKTVSYVVIN